MSFFCHDTSLGLSFLSFYVKIHHISDFKNFFYIYDYINLFYYKQGSKLTTFFDFFQNPLTLASFLYIDNKKISTFTKNYLSSDYHFVSRTFNNFSENSRFIKRTQGLKLPFRLIKELIVDDNCFTSFFFKWQFGTGFSNLQEKFSSNTSFLVLKQKKYTRKDNITSVIVNDDFSGNLIKYTGKNILLNNSIFFDYINDSNSVYRLVKKNKKRMETIPITLAKRLLRVKRTLVLPAHLNITLITNSFDIVHS
jgi:hypothetical protein